MFYVDAIPIDHRNSWIYMRICKGDCNRKNELNNGNNYTIVLNGLVNSLFLESSYHPKFCFQKILSGNFYENGDLQINISRRVGW